MADQKTEKPTPQRKKKAREEGRFPASRDLLASGQLMLAMTLALSLGGGLFTALEQSATLFLRSAFLRHEFTLAQIPAMEKAGFLPPLVEFLKLALFVNVGVLALQLGITQFGISTKQLSPNFSKLNPMSRLKGMPGQNIASTLKALVLLPLIGVVLYLVIAPQMADIANLSAVGLGAGLQRASQIIQTLLWRLLFLLLVVGLVDYVRQLRKFNQEMRMSKQEIKDEAKDSDGNPQMKMQIRRLRRDMIRKNMIKAVPQATVVIVNPTHFAVAILYEMGSKAVPSVVAKGQDYLALAIKERARQHEIPIVENKPLARALYDATEVGQEIPPHLYRAVAEVLAHIYKSLNQR